MLLKKQTVWLLTMLSLVVVLSVYYITSPEGMQDDLAYDEEGVENTETAGEANATGDAEGEGQSEVNVEQVDDTVISSITSDEAFTALRMQITDEREKLKQQLQDIVANSDVSAADKSNALDKIQYLSEVATKEKVLETLIKSKGYDDALVRADGDKVRITVKAPKHSAPEAVDLIQLAKSEISELKNVAVTFEPTK